MGMQFKVLDRTQVASYLSEIYQVAYSDQFAEFARLAYESTRSFVGIFKDGELKAFFPVFERAGRQRIAEVPLFIYTELFFVDSQFVIKGDTFGRELLDFLGCDVLRLNIFKPRFPAQFKTEGFNELFTAMVLSLGPYHTFDEYLHNAISGNARSKIYKGESSGFQLSQLSERELPGFYELYRSHVAHLQSKPHSLEYFKQIFASHHPGEDLFMFGVRHEGKLVSANLFFLNKEYLEVKFLADDIRERRLFPNNFLYAEMIKWALVRGVSAIDFGGIPNGMRGNIEFKKSFGAQEYPIYTRYFFKNIFQLLRFKVRRKIENIRKSR